MLPGENQHYPLTRIARSTILVSILPAGLMQTRPYDGVAAACSLSAVPASNE